MLSGGIILVAILFIFGNTIPKKVAKDSGPVATPLSQPAFNTAQLIQESRKRLSPEQVSYLDAQEARLSQDNQKIAALRTIGNFWMDSVHQHILGAYYFGEAAKLENSEKNLTFAAHLLLEELMSEQEPAMQTWLGNNTKVLFEKVLELNPGNDSAKIGIGACYMFGNISDQPMEGIMRVRQVAEKDTTNMYAQFMLGLGGIRSGQFDKAVKRFETVIKNEPENLRAVFHLAETYDRLSDKANAIKWYTVARDKIQVPQAKEDLGERIKALQLN